MRLGLIVLSLVVAGMTLGTALAQSNVGTIEVIPPPAEPPAEPPVTPPADPPSDLRPEPAPPSRSGGGGGGSSGGGGGFTLGPFLAMYDTCGPESHVRLAAATFGDNLDARIYNSDFEVLGTISDVPGTAYARLSAPLNLYVFDFYHEEKVGDFVAHIFDRSGKESAFPVRIAECKAYQKLFPVQGLTVIPPQEFVLGQQQHPGTGNGGMLEDRRCKPTHTPMTADFRDSVACIFHHHAEKFAERGWYHVKTK